MVRGLELLEKYPFLRPLVPTDDAIETMVHEACRLRLKQHTEWTRAGRTSGFGQAFATYLFDDQGHAVDVNGPTTISLAIARAQRTPKYVVTVLRQDIGKRSEVLIKLWTVK